MDPVRVYVGTDRSQQLAVKVLEHSIKRHTKLEVKVFPMCDLPVPKPKDPKQGQRTGFSFSRFCIPELAGYRGKAIYMDADMLVMKDIEELWTLPFNGAKVIIQEELSEQQSKGTAQKPGAPSKRIKQCAVMLLDCGRLDWNIKDIVNGLDEQKYDYGQLMYELCILKEDEIRYGVPFRWNSLEYYDKDTALIHYTDMTTQPWVSPLNKNAGIWFDEVRLMLKDGSLTEDEIRKEVELGYFRPSILNELRWGNHAPAWLSSLIRGWYAISDKKYGYRQHKAVLAEKARRESTLSN